MEQLFDELALRMNFFNAIDITHASDTQEYIDAKGRAIDALNDYIDKRIEKLVDNRFLK